MQKELYGIEGQFPVAVASADDPSFLPGQNIGGYAFAFEPVDHSEVRKVMEFIANETNMVLTEVSMSQATGEFAMVTLKVAARAAVPAKSESARG